MKLPYYQVLKISVEDKTTLKAEWLDCVTCDECAYLNVQNTKYLYAICERHGIEFKPFEDDTRTHGCAWGDRKTEQTEPQTHDLRTNTHECVKDTHDKTENCSEIPNNCEVECEKCKHFREEADTYMKQCEYYFMECRFEPKTEPQTERSSE